MNSLKLPLETTQAINRLARAKKDCLLQEAINWEGCTTDGQYIEHVIWESDDKQYRVSLQKYGKEFYGVVRWKDKHQEHNPNDMKPTLFHNGVEVNNLGSFDEIFRFLQEAYFKDSEGAQVLGCLLYRDALLLDHTDNGGSYRYNPPKDALDYIKQRIPEWEGIEIEAFLRYLDAIAWNEDVKYYSIGYDVMKGSIGRKNNLLTYARLIAVLLGKASLSKLCGSFSRPPVGVSAITKKEAQDAYPQLW